MKTIRSIALAAGCCVALLWAAQAKAAQGFYLNADAGIALSQNVEVKQFVYRTPGAKWEFDPGARLTVAGGYHFCDYMSAQIESGFIGNTIDNVGGWDEDASLSHVPLLADVVFRYDKQDCKWVPFIGAGIGGDFSVISFDYVSSPDGGYVDGTDTDFVFAWQVFAGARYKLNEKMSIGAGYQFYYANGASWNLEHSAGEIRTGEALVHSFGVDFSMKF